MSAFLKNLLLKRPLQCLGASLLLMAVLLPNARHLSVSFGPASWFEENSPELIFLDEFKKSFEVDETFVVAIENEDGLFNKKMFELIAKTTDELWLVHDIIRVDSLTNYNLVETEEDDILIRPVYDEESETDFKTLKSKVLGHEDLPGYLISKDGTTSLIFSSIKPVFEGIPDYLSIRKDIQTRIDKLQNEYPDSKFHILGSGALNAALKEVSFNDLKILFPLFFLFIVVTFFLFFKSFTGVFIPLMIVIITNLTVFGLAGLIGIKIVTISFVIPIILMAIGIADSIHILEVFFNNYHQNGDKRLSLEMTLEKNLMPTFYTSVTTSIGFFSLLAADLIPIKELGLICGIGVMIAWFFSFTLLVPSCLYLPIKKKNRQKRDSIRTNTGDRFLSFINSHYKSIIVGFIILTIAMIGLGLTNQINSNPYQNFAKHLPIRKANDFFLQKIGGLGGPQILVDSGREDGIYQPDFLKKVESFQNWLVAKEKINNVNSILNVLKQTNRALNDGSPDQFRVPKTSQAVAEQIFLYGLSVPQGKSLNNLISSDKSKLRMSILWEIQDSVSGTAEMDVILKKATSLGLDATITGNVALTQKMVGKVIGIFIKSLMLSILMISLIFFLIFKNFKLGLLALLPNILPVVFTSGILVLIGQDIDFTIAISSSICLGIAVDDTIHFISHYLKLGDLEVQDRLKEIFRSTGSSLVLTTIVLVIGFGIFLFADFVPNRNFGILTGCSLMVALVADLLLLPAILIALEKTRQNSGILKKR